jgi:hypothetical protein
LSFTVGPRKHTREGRKKQQLSTAVRSIMNYINQAASALNSGIDVVVKYITENGTAIAILLAVAFFIRSQGE